MHKRLHVFLISNQGLKKTCYQLKLGSILIRQLISQATLCVADVPIQCGLYGLYFPDLHKNYGDLSCDRCTDSMWYYMIGLYFLDLQKTTVTLCVADVPIQCGIIYELYFLNLEEMWYYIWAIFSRFTGNYGVLGILDRLHNTDKVFRESSRYRKHRLIFSAKALNWYYTFFSFSIASHLNNTSITSDFVVHIRFTKFNIVTLLKYVL